MCSYLAHREALPIHTNLAHHEALLHVREAQLLAHLRSVIVQLEGQREGSLQLEGQREGSRLLAVRRLGSLLVLEEGRRSVRGVIHAISRVTFTVSAWCEAGCCTALALALA